MEKNMQKSKKYDKGKIGHPIGKTGHAMGNIHYINYPVTIVYDI